MKCVHLALALLTWQVVAQTDDPAQLRKELAELDKLIAANPKRADAFQERGGVHFKLGDFKASVRDFDRYIELRPERKTRHWQRGISCYYAGQYDEGRKQFEIYHNDDDGDVENVVWRFMCMAKADGMVKARQAMLKVGDDRRVPMRQVYELFSGKLKADDVFAAAQAGNPDKARLSHQLFYAHLYVGIYLDLEGNTRQALFHITKAADEYRIDHYMGDVARVHRDLLRKLLDKKQ